MMASLTTIIAGRARAWCHLALTWGRRVVDVTRARPRTVAVAHPRLAGRARATTWRLPRPSMLPIPSPGGGGGHASRPRSAPPPGQAPRARLCEKGGLGVAGSWPASCNAALRRHAGSSWGVAIIGWWARSPPPHHRHSWRRPVRGCPHRQSRGGRVCSHNWAPLGMILLSIHERWGGVACGVWAPPPASPARRQPRAAASACCGALSAGSADLNAQLGATFPTNTGEGGGGSGGLGGKAGAFGISTT